jgi:3-deoxy-D-manno-octulosonate 8-phosphate phosphatase (KDO 8-P phosphatase)
LDSEYAHIKAVAMDVDGVLTDGTVTIDETGRESKRVSFADIMGVSLGRRAGLHFALISGEASPCLDHIACKFGITDVYAGCKDKAAALAEFAGKHHLALSDICFVGDDVNDLGALGSCGLAVVPSDAHASARARAVLVTDTVGGLGAVREVIDRLLAGGAPGERMSGTEAPSR